MLIEGVPEYQQSNTKHACTVAEMHTHSYYTKKQFNRVTYLHFSACLKLFEVNLIDNTLPLCARHSKFANSFAPAFYLAVTTAATATF
jgi:hypothetical protein